ncbi:MAG: M20/M25/M40 family metallo-hydrolase [Actinobacteria bacterium]|nr:M20/M25/M40 family metallo-hydrolase [Actinomycetota bacterium]
MNPDVVQLTQELVKINSITPEGKSEWAKHGGESRLAQWLHQFFSESGWHCDLMLVKENRPNLIARPDTFNPDLPTVAFQAHMDTVDVEGMSIPPFSADIHDNCLWGRGACDVKGTMAAMITAIMKWTQKSKTATFNLIFMATMGEENGTLGSKYFAQHSEPIDMIIIGEPTSLQPVIGHKGLWRFAVETHGVSCHSSMPKEGLNAIEGMLPIINFLKKDLKSSFEQNSENSFSLTQIHGGSAINIIPDLCRVEIDTRFQNGTEIEEFRTRILQKLAEKESEIYQPVFKEIEYAPAFRTVKNSHLLELLQKSLKKYNIKNKTQIAPWYSDAGFISTVVPDAIIWGAGDIRFAHTIDERISLEQLHTAVTVLLQFLSECEDYYGSKQHI